MRGALVLFLVAPRRPGPLFGVEMHAVHRHARRVRVGPRSTKEWVRSGVRGLTPVPRPDPSSPVGLSYRRVPADRGSPRPSR